ncbi:MAG TPA: tetratricopeptide repeat protein [Rhodanobacteraceae bacterium]|nr:tetratricopeptide repeat protein [Rhodanobacteraceae bacterium]
MKTWQLCTLIAAAALLSFAGLLWDVHGKVLHVAAQGKHLEVVRDEGNQPLPRGRAFTRAETNDFLDAAQRAEKIADPLQRCLAYPDPPGSHWDHAVVVAYCKYRNPPTITFAQVQQMIQAGHADELDRMFEKALQAQMSDPDARGRLDFTFFTAFGPDASFDVRATLDAWKRQSPASAFAYAASGYEYERMAFAARGSDYISKTPFSNIDSMDRLAQLADADLQQAIKLNPKITPVYVTMISLGAMTLGEGYALAAAKRGLAQDTANFDIYSKLVWFEQPNWYGSLPAMDGVARDAQKHADRNPLLRTLLSERDLYRIDKCKCTPVEELSAYDAVLDHAAMRRTLNDAGYAAKDAGDAPAMTIYLSEALRFDPTLHDTRIDRIYDLVEFDRIPWAIDEANRLIAANPNDEYSLKARGWAYSIGSDAAHAQQDYEAALKLNPDDGWVQAQLAGAYMSDQQWDKAWALADREIEKNPGEVDGWGLRAAIQEQQPRPGLKDTADYLESHFFTDKKNLQFNAYIAHLRTVAQQRDKAKPKGASVATRPN